MNYRHIRRKDNPLKGLGGGYVGPGGLGEFDPEIYEEVEGPLPEGFEIETVKTLDQQMDEVLNEQPMAVQIQLAPLMAAGKLFIDTNRLDRLAALIEGAEVPQDLEPLRSELLALIPQ